MYFNSTEVYTVPPRLVCRSSSRDLTIRAASPPVCNRRPVSNGGLPPMLELWPSHTKMETRCFFPSYANRTKCSRSLKGALLSLL